MSEKSEKKLIPAYIGFNSFLNFINGLRESGIPLKIDRSVLPKVSGSQFSSTMAALRFLRLVDDNDKPAQKMQELVNASDDGRKDIFLAIFKDAYGFLFTDPDFHLDKATGNQVATKFRSQDVSGSTVSKCIGFFLAFAQAAGVKVSSHVKAPSVPRSNVKREAKAVKKNPVAQVPENENELPDGERPGYMRITIPLHGMGDGALYLPEGLSPRQRAYALKITKFLLDNYWLDDETQDALDEIEGENK